MPLFSNGPRPVENFNLSFLERDFNLTSNSNVNDYFFPAHVELLPEYGVTPSLFRLPRSTAPRVDFWRKPATEHAAHVAKTGKPYLAHHLGIGEGAQAVAQAHFE